MRTTADPRFREREVRMPLLVVGVVLFLGSELMFFASLFGTYFTLRVANPGAWAPPEVQVDAARLLFTSILVASSGTMQMGVRAIKRGDGAAMRRWVWLTLLMGVVFLAGQGAEWAGLNFQISTDAYGSTFYAMTGFHGLHVLAGLLVMLVVLGRAAAGAYGREEHAGVEVAAYYWHFVDVVWIGLFLTLFVIR
ncbi:MAG: cytochrome c oxidase subunit 3 [Actinobacteria bacterium]|nr:cytochrome c oxidase subunit 3 [Actinomycetota bacterium]